mgnify:CR=1 FL=1
MPKTEGKSKEELREFNILGFLGGGYESQTSGSSSRKIGYQSRHGLTDSVSTKTSTYQGMSFDVFTKFPLFKVGSKPHYRIYDLPTNMGIVRTRQRSILSSENRLKKHLIKKDGLNKKSPQYNRSLKCITRKIESEKQNQKLWKHEMEYRLRLLNEIRKNIDISHKGSIRRPNNSVKQYRFRIYWWGKRREVYLGSKSDLMIGFKHQKKFNDFEEYLKDMGRKLFLRKLGEIESNVRIAQRELKKLK